MIKYLVPPQEVALSTRVNQLIATRLQTFDLLTVSSQMTSSLTEIILISVGQIARSVGFALESKVDCDRERCLTGLLFLALLHKTCVSILNKQINKTIYNCQKKEIN